MGKNEPKGADWLVGGDTTWPSIKKKRELKSESLPLPSTRIGVVGIRQIPFGYNFYKSGAYLPRYAFIWFCIYKVAPKSVILRGKPQY